ncbi:MAG TPA: DUF6782 family putative metallopeptidase [Acidobacteriota bacterium]|nr:DUF6782 family putative metallopeptidase [Acidobacteriota bacterium]
MRILLMFFFTLLLIAGGPVPAAAQAGAAPELLEAAEEMVEITSLLRGLPPKTSILKGIKNREEISAYLNKLIDEDYDPALIRQEGKMLGRLGLIPPGSDYREIMLNLLSEQVGGFYDPERNTLFIASWLPAEEQKPVMIHELTHALQDHHFDLKSILSLSRERANNDRSMAHQALVEGDAMAVMLQYFLAPAKRHFSELPNLADIMRAQMHTMQAQFDVFRNAPAFLQETILFPYGYGASFIQYAWKQYPSWNTVNKIYADLPASTEQIMHPEKYFGERDNPRPVNAQSYADMLAPDWRVTYKNTMGEFSLGLLLNLHLTAERSRRAATGWGGDQALLLENESGSSAALVYTVWDSAADAEKFFLAMDEWFRRNFPKASRRNETSSGFSLVHDGEFNSLRLDGNAVRFIIGLPEKESRRLKDFQTPAAPVTS